MAGAAQGFLKGHAKSKKFPPMGKIRQWHHWKIKAFLVVKGLRCLDECQIASTLPLRDFFMGFSGLKFAAR